MKVIIAGGRTYHLTADDIDFIERSLVGLPAVTEVVSGGANGADLDGEKWARSKGIAVKRFVADWGKHGKAAGPIRNKEMAEYADVLIAFPGSKGTANMIQEAKTKGLNIFVQDRQVTTTNYNEVMG